VSFLSENLKFQKLSESSGHDSNGSVDFKFILLEQMFLRWQNTSALSLSVLEEESPSVLKSALWLLPLGNPSLFTFEKTASPANKSAT
jgi:hypothetical protein